LYHSYAAGRASSLGVGIDTAPSKTLNRLGRRTVSTVQEIDHKPKELEHMDNSLFRPFVATITQVLYATATPQPFSTEQEGLK
jgi:hypothetical protein